MVARACSTRTGSITDTIGGRGITPEKLVGRAHSRSKDGTEKNRATSHSCDVSGATISDQRSDDR